MAQWNWGIRTCAATVRVGADGAAVRETHFPRGLARDVLPAVESPLEPGRRTWAGAADGPLGVWAPARPLLLPPGPAMTGTGGAPV